MHHDLILRTLQATNVNLLVIVFHLSADSVYKVLNELVIFLKKVLLNVLWQALH